MRLRKLLVLIVLTCIFNDISAQKRQNVYFYKDNGREVFSKDSADFIRIIQEPDSGAVYFNLIELYADGKKKTLGSVSSFLPNLKYEGQLINYYPNGKKQCVANYEKNLFSGPVYYFFENGRLNKTYEIKAKIPGENELYTNIADTLVMYVADSTGRVVVENGNGHVVEQVSSYNGSVVEGDYKDGAKHGFWILKSNDGLFSYKEQYEMGKFIAGESEQSGIKSSYKSVDELPSMKGGMQTFYNYLARSIRYPADAQEKNIQGKVYLSFNIETDGSIANVKVERRLSTSLDAEAVRVLRASPKWIPGKKHGFPVRVKYNIPLSFTLSQPVNIHRPDNGFNNPRGF